MRQQNSYKTYTFEELLNEEGGFLYTNIGTSMMPLLRQRKDLIEIRKKERKIKKYDVALYKRDDKYILHRCIKVTPDGYVFAGDHNAFKEYDVTDDMIIGLMSRVIRDGREINLSSVSYRLYSFLWVNFFWLKVVLLKFRRLLQRASRITPSKLWYYFNRKLIKAIDRYNDYRITGLDLTKCVKDSTSINSECWIPNYLTINKILLRANLSHKDSVIVVGCGKGRVIASLLRKHGECEIYGIDENEAFVQICTEWSKKYKNVHIACDSVFSVDYNQFSVLYLNRSFSVQDANKYIRFIERQMQHHITVVHPFDQSSKSIFENRPGWMLQCREEFFKIHGFQVAGTIRRFSIWRYVPNVP